jgi:ferredoxin--NADP+ reductase
LNLNRSSVAQNTLSVVIVGSGPSAFFTAEALLQSGCNVRVAILERLPLPFGLVRFGVAPDHQHTRRVADTMGAILNDERVRFYGNVEFGKDIFLSDLKQHFDAIVLATGASNDARLGINGEDLANAVGSAEVVGWYNGHPQYAGRRPHLGAKNVAIIGMGNVALDIARILSGPPDRLRGTDISPLALAALENSSIENVFVIGRKSPFEAKFSYPELRELSSLEGVVATTDPLTFPANPPPDAKKSQLRTYDVFRSFAANDPASKPKRIHFVFNAVPIEVRGQHTVQSLVLEQRSSIAGTQSYQLSCGLVVTAIGFRSAPLRDVPFDHTRMIVPNIDGRVGHRVYAVGWISRGPNGVIGTHKPAAYTVASHIIGEGPDTKSHVGLEGLEETLRSRNIEWMSQQ